MPTYKAAIVCGPGEGEQLDTRSNLLRGDRNELALFESVVKSGDGNKPHLHRQHADAFYVLEGELEVFVGGLSTRLGPGGLMVAPPGVSHFFRNRGPNPERNLNFHAPGEHFIALARARARGEAVDVADFDTFAPEPGGDGLVSGPGEGERLAGEHGEYLIKAVLPQLSVVEHVVRTGATDRGLHRHERHVEMLYVLAGNLEFTFEGKAVDAGEGTSVVIPPGLSHAIRNSGPKIARVLNVHAPESGYVDYLRLCARGESFDRARHDIHYVE